MKLKVENGVIYLPESFEPANADIVLCAFEKGVKLFLPEYFEEYVQQLDKDESKFSKFMKRYVLGRSLTAMIEERKICLPLPLREYLPDGEAELQVGEDSIEIVRADGEVCE